MKQFLTTLLITGLLFSVVAGNGQQKADGIYASMNDYLTNHLQYAHSRVKLHSQQSYLRIQWQQEQQELPRDSVFAVALSSGKTYRLVGHEYYQLLNKNEQLLLYKKKVMVSGKAFPNDTFRYYFSASNGPVRALTSWNLKQAFPQMASWPDKLDENFRQDADLMAYDSFHRMYKLEWLLQ